MDWIPLDQLGDWPFRNKNSVPFYL